jgi:uncharacterized protein (TIRG00374 family)
MIFISLLILKPEYILFLTNKISLLSSKWNKEISEKIKNKINALLISFKEFKSKKLIFLTLVFSILIYLSAVISTFLVMLSLGYNLPITVLIITLSFSILSSLLPINAFAGLGTIESIWVIVLSYFNYSIETAILLSFSVHIIQLTFSSIFGFFGWLKIGKMLY